MKRIVSILLILTLAVALSACGGTEQPAQTEPPVQTRATEAVTEPTVAETTAPPDLITVAYVPCGIVSDWHSTCTASFQQTFTPENGYELLCADVDADGAAQVEAVREYIQQGADYLVISPLEKDGWKDVLQEARDAGIPVIIADRDIDVRASMYDAYVGTNPDAEGKLAASWLAEYLQGAKAQIVMIEGLEDAYVTRWRSKGFETVAAENSQWKITGRQFGDFTREGGKAAMEAQLKKSKKFDVVVCHNDEMAFGVMEALNEAGIAWGVEGDVVLISFDATREGLKQTLEGKIHCNVECNPLRAEQVQELIRMMEAGEDFPSFTLVPSNAFAAPGLQSDYAQPVTQEILDNRSY